LPTALLAHGAAPIGFNLISPAAAEEIERIAEDVPLVSSGDCYSVGEKAAAQEGGTLARATAATQGDQQVCLVVVLIPPKAGERPRRPEATVLFMQRVIETTGAGDDRDHVPMIIDNNTQAPSRIAAHPWHGLHLVPVHGSS
jgi:hypothetical protein